MDVVNRTHEKTDIVAAPNDIAASKHEDTARSSTNDQLAQTKSKIAETAKLLSSRDDLQLDEDDISLGDEDEDQSSALEDDEALAELHFAATRRRDLDRSHLREARIVEPVYGKEALHSVPVKEDISQKDMMWRMMRALSNTEEGDGGTGRAALEKKIRRLHANGKKALSVPLPAPVQGRLDRASAYDDTKEEVGKKWGAIVQKNRKAKKLVFPLNGPGKDTGGNTNAIAGNFKPEANYEEEIESLLRQAGVSTDQDVLKQEDNGAGGLETTPVTKEEVLKRRRELAKIRSLMFHYEHKMKRIKKIKSKKYRRVMKKEKEKIAQTMGDSDDEETKARRAEQRRVEERMTLRHKNTSKWVRRQLQRKEGNRNPATKAAIEEQLRMHEELRRRQESEMNGAETSDDEGSAGDGPNENDISDEEDALKQELMKDARKMNRKGIMGMRFMKEAEERKRKEALALLEAMKQETGEEETEETLQAVGRQAFKGQQSKEDSNSEANVDPDEPNTTQNGVDIAPVNVNVKAPSPQADPDSGDEVPTKDMNADGKVAVGFGFTTKLNGRLTADINPWLTGSGQGDDEKSAPKTNDPDHSQGNGGDRSAIKDRPLQVTTSQKSSFPTLKSKGNIDDETKETKKDGVSSQKRHRLRRRQTQRDNSIQEEVQKLAEPDGELLRMQDISQAFAGVGGAEEAEFDTAKQSEVERNMPTAQSLQAEVLPGWGSWDGAGMPKAKRRRTETPFAKAARERLEAARANAANKRSDRTMRHVILNEKRIKQATDLTLSSVPFPFTSREQWEREVDTSVCRETVSTAAYKQAIGKRVVANPGTVIEPIRQSQSSEKNTHRGKRGIIELRKERSQKRSKARRGLMT